MLKCFNVISYFILACVIPLVVLYLITLVRVIRGARYRFLIYVIVMLLISNLGSVATIFATNVKYLERTEVAHRVDSRRILFRRALDSRLQIQLNRISNAFLT